LLKAMTPMGNRGFTLIEALVAMAVLGIMMAYGMPMYTAWIQNAQIRTAAESISNGLQLARNEAVRLNRPVRFELTDAANTAWRICLWDTPNNDCMAGPNIQERNGVDGGQNASVGGSNMDDGNYAVALMPGNQIPAGVTFNPMGRSDSPGFDLRRIDVRNTVLSAAEERRLVILLSIAGQSRMCDPKHIRTTNAQGC
jgi:type IV fimbrial biogenesis protein FimT